MKILAIDIGGTNVKVKSTEAGEARKFPSGRELTPKQMVDGVLELTKDWDYEAVAAGYPGPVVHGQPRSDRWRRLAETTPRPRHPRAGVQPGTCPRIPWASHNLSSHPKRAP